MADEGKFDAWLPAQDTAPETIDFRAIKTGPKGYKEKNKRKHVDLDAEDGDQMDEDPAEEADAMNVEQSTKRRKAEGSTYIPIYERVLKAPRERASKVMKATNKTSWDKKMRDKATNQMFKEAKKEAITVMKDKRKADAAHRKQAREKKAANKEKSMVVQKITNNATLKKMMKNKKQKKLLKKADTN